MKINIPDKYWDNLKEHIKGADYCYLCDRHPSSRHNEDCPIAKELEEKEDE